MPEVDYTPRSSFLFLPPTINPTSLILRLHYDCRRSPALLIISSSFTSPSAPLTPLFLHVSFLSSVLILFFLKHTSSDSKALFSVFVSIYFISLADSTSERNTQQVRNERTGQGVVSSLLLSQLSHFREE